MVELMAEKTQKKETDPGSALRPARQLPSGLPAFEAFFEYPERRLEVEIGCGKARYLLARAERDPEINFLGIDYAKKWMGIGRDRGLKRGLPNVRFIHSEAFMLVDEYLPDGRVSVFHVYFPDPWPKRRHHKRRLLGEAFFELLYRKLEPGGRLEIATDFEDYFAGIRKTMQRSRTVWSHARESVNKRLFDPEIKTNFEIKYEAEGRRLFYLELVK